MGNSFRGDRFTLEQTLADQETFVKDILSNEELKKYHDNKPTELLEALQYSCLKGIREGVNAFIKKQKGTSKSLFDYDINKFFYEADIKTPVCRNLARNATVKKYFTIKGVQDAPEVFGDDIGHIMHDEYRHHVQEIADPNPRPS